MTQFDMETLGKIQAGELAADFETVKPLARPEGITNGVMLADPEKCTGCGLCIKNCPFKCWEMGPDNVPRMKEHYICFSCFNCLIACPREAVSIGQTFSVKDAFFDTDFPSLKLPLEPRDKEGQPAEWTEIERHIMNRRSVRNFKPEPVSEPLIRRVLEAGRFAPSAGNHQPWKFAVVTDPEFAEELAQEIPFYRVRHAVKPGMAGWGLVKQGYGSSKEDALIKLQYDLYYIKHQSLWLDIIILLKTIVDTVTFGGR